MNGTARDLKQIFDYSSAAFWERWNLEKLVSTGLEELWGVKQD